MARITVIVPLGSIPDDLLRWLVRQLPEAVGGGVALAEPVAPPAEGYDPTRRQYQGERILARLQTIQYPGADRCLGLIDADCYAPGLNFIFGQATLDAQLPAAFVALPRLRPAFNGEPENPSLFYARVLKEAVHELGHTFGLQHCPDSKCVMHFSNTLADTDVKSDRFCARCQSLLAGQKSA